MALPPPTVLKILYRDFKYGIYPICFPRRRYGLGLGIRPDSPCSLLLQLGAEQQVCEEKDMTKFPGTFHQLHHETVPQQLSVLGTSQKKSHQHIHHLTLISRHSTFICMK